MSRNPESNDDRQALEAKLKLLPASPGVYLHKDAQGKVLYVGKALHLNQRVRSYFQDAADHAPRIRDLVRRVDGADLTNGDILALIGLLQQAMKSNGLR